MWQEQWDNRYDDHSQGIVAPASQSIGVETVGQLFDHLHALRESTVAPITTDRDRYKLRLFREELGAELPLSALTSNDLAAALARIGNRISPGTANAALALVKTYLNWAVNEKLLGDESHRKVRRLKVARIQRHRSGWWTVGEVELALRCAKKDYHQPSATLLVACGCYLGLRPEEIIMQRWEDCDLDAIDTSTGKARPVCHVTAHDGWKPKDGEERSIPICSPLLSLLMDHRQRSGYLLQAEAHRPGRPRGGGKGLDYRYDPKKLWSRIQLEIVKAGGKKITMYGMRHTFASNLLIANVSDVKVARWLGSSDTRMLHKHYGHLLSYDDDINVDERGARGA